MFWAYANVDRCLPTLNFNSGLNGWHRSSCFHVCVFLGFVLWHKQNPRIVLQLHSSWGYCTFGTVHLMVSYLFSATSCVFTLTLGVKAGKDLNSTAWDVCSKRKTLAGTLKKIEQSPTRWMSKTNPVKMRHICCCSLNKNFMVLDLRWVIQVL